TAEAAPEIELPGKAKAVIPLAKPALGRGNSVSDIDADAFPHEVAVHDLRLREKLADRNAQLGPSLEYPEAGLPQRQVLLIGGQDQVVEGLVVEDSPPITIVSLVAVNARVVGIYPMLGDRSGWPFVVGPDFEAIADILERRGATACEQRQEQ